MLNINLESTMDSFPVAVCDNKRIGRLRMFEENILGYKPSKR
jgi:hypothetical protein